MSVLNQSISIWGDIHGDRFNWAFEIYVLGILMYSLKVIADRISPNIHLYTQRNCLYMRVDLTCPAGMAVQPAITNVPQRSSIFMMSHPKIKMYLT